MLVQDFDKMASRHARFLFDEIDSMLYEHENNGPPHLVKECHEWRTEFPHLRSVNCATVCYDICQIYCIIQSIINHNDFYTEIIIIR